jgi:hypothetical protein
MEQSLTGYYYFHPQSFHLIIPSLFYQSTLLKYRGADKSLARPTSRCILFDGENISFDDASLVIYTNSTNTPQIMIINGIYEHQNLLSL